MRGSSLDVYVTTPSNSDSGIYTGPTVPKFVQDLTVHTPDSRKLTKYVDVSTVLATTDSGTRQIRIAIVNRNETEEYDVPIILGRDVSVKELIEVHEVWHEDLKATNWFGDEKVKAAKREEKFTGTYHLKRHSFQSELPFSFPFRVAYADCAFISPSLGVLSLVRVRTQHAQFLMYRGNYEFMYLQLRRMNYTRSDICKVHLEDGRGLHSLLRVFTILPLL